MSQERTIELNTFEFAKLAIDHICPECSSTMVLNTFPSTSWKYICKKCDLLTKPYSVSSDTILCSCWHEPSTHNGCTYTTYKLKEQHEST